jgi:hypothetical protein
MNKAANTKIILTAIIFFGIFGLAKISQAATLYVCPSGCQYSTIQAAANVVNPGDTVIVRDGTYTGGSYIVNLKRGGTASSWITFKAENKWGAKINGGHTSEDGFFLETGAHYIRIEDFEIYGTRNSGIFLNADSQTIPPPTVWAHHIYIKGCKIHDIARVTDNTDYGNSGIDTDWPCSDLTVDGNIFYNIGRLNWYTTPKAVPNGNQAENEATCTSAVSVACYNHDHGLYLRGPNNTIINNIFYPDFKSGWPIQGGKSAFGSNLEFKVINNTFYGANPMRDSIWSFSEAAASTHLTLQNNIVMNPTNYCFRYNSQLTNVDIYNNLCYGATFISSSGCSKSGYDCANNIEGQDPKFENLANKDFRLQSTSPAINKGLAYSGRTVDADGKSIVGLPDIGAYEYGGGGFDTTPPAVPQGLTVK